eukprot:1191471-Amphidinium_carterae.1
MRCGRPAQILDYTLCGLRKRAVTELVAKNQAQLSIAESQLPSAFVLKQVSVGWRVVHADIPRFHQTLAASSLALVAYQQSCCMTAAAQRHLWLQLLTE